MRAIIYYFSGTGNTLKACECFRDSLEKLGVECTLFPVTSPSMPAPDQFDFVGIAYPVHAFNAPYVMYKFVRGLPRQNGKKFFIVTTSGEPLCWNNSSSCHLRGKLKKRGFELTNEYHYVMPYNMIFRHTDMQAQKMWQTAKALISLDAVEVVDGKKSLLKTPPFGRFVSWVLRIEHGAMKVNGRFFKVKKSCVKCMKCVKNCPVGNISYDEKSGKFRFGGNCIMCTRCSFSCPKDAIKIGVLNGWRVNGAYNFENPNEAQTCRKPNYCKKAYKRYFADAEKRIVAANVESSAENCEQESL